MIWIGPLPKVPTYGFVKVLTEPGKDRILGVTIVGANAGEMLPEFVLAMNHGLGLNKIMGTIHVYPTWSEGNKLRPANGRKPTSRRNCWPGPSAISAGFEAPGQANPVRENDRCSWR